MRIRWSNVIAAVLLIAGISWTIAHRSELSEFVDSMRWSGPRGTSDEQMLGLMAFIVIVLCGVLAIRRLTSGRGER